MIAAKGGSSENKSKIVMLNPSDDIAEWVAKTVPTMGAGWCPPGMLGLGIGGTAESYGTCKESLMDPVISRVNCTRSRNLRRNCELRSLIV